MEIKKLILKFTLFSLILTAVFYFALWQVAQGQVDYYYTKFTHKGGSLLVGSSRVLYGISPEVIAQNFDEKEINYPIVNFGFSHQVSDYGPIYLEAIKEKLQSGNKKCLFILDVTPASLSILSTLPDTISSIENEPSFLSEIDDFNRHPNFEYIRKLYSHSLYKGFKKSRRIDLIRYSHTDGWLELLTKYQSYEVSEKEVQTWRDLTVEGAIEKQDNFKPSEVRLQYLEKTIEFLKTYGQVYLIRVPISNDFLDVEQSYWPDFNNRISQIAEQYNVVYFDYTKQNDQYNSFDASHLFGYSAKKFTQQLCNDIKSLNNQITN